MEHTKISLDSIPVTSVKPSRGNDMISVIIPAHNEERMIGRCLKALLSGKRSATAEVIVVCNGCVDKTAEIARQFPGVIVVELTQASKASALNFGDKMTSGSPIAYVDADIEVTFEDLLSAIKQLDRPGVKVVAPQLEVETSRSGLLVKAFYAIWMRLPYISNGQMVGLGVYILSKGGRSRFAEFPQLISDDGYVRSLFELEERLTATDCKFKAFAPETVANLIKIKTRARLGNLELKLKYPSTTIGGDNKVGSFFALLFRKPWLAGAGLIYVYLQWKIIKCSSLCYASKDFYTWERDESSRRAYK